MTNLTTTANHRQCCLATMVLGGIALFLLTGCRNKDEPVVASGNILTGKVTLDNQPVKIGMVHAFNDAGISVGNTIIDPMGLYSLDKLPEGKLKLAVLPPPMMGRKTGKEPPPIKDGKGGPPPGLGKDEFPPELRELMKTIENMPARYSSPATAELSVQIKGELTEFDIKMSK